MKREEGGRGGGREGNRRVEYKRRESEESRRKTVKWMIGSINKK